MPELVEVETTRRDLSKLIINKRIEKVDVYLDKIVYNKAAEFIKKVQGSIILDVKRRGKWLLFELDKSYLVIHFRMEGRFYYQPKDAKKDKHDYVIFYFNDASLHYNDPRLFGKMEIIEKDKIEDFFKDRKLGLEYTDINLTSSYLKKRFKSHHTDIKKMLLDQSFITGIGNIYADEILFRSGINPKCYADKLSTSKLDLIIKNTKEVFEEALKYKGTYPNIDGKRGTYEQHLLVHMRKGLECFKCKTIIVKEKVGGRGTYYCPMCQKNEKRNIIK